VRYLKKTIKYCRLIKRCMPCVSRFFSMRVRVLLQTRYTLRKIVDIGKNRRYNCKSFRKTVCRGRFLIARTDRRRELRNRDSIAKPQQYCRETVQPTEPLKTEGMNAANVKAEGFGRQGRLDIAHSRRICPKETKKKRAGTGDANHVPHQKLKS